MKTISIFSLLLCALLLKGASPYANKALNPVLFEVPNDNRPIELVKDGRLNFVIVCDTQAENKEISQRQSIRIATIAIQDAFERSTGQKTLVLDASSKELSKYPFQIVVGKNSITDKLGLKPLALPVNGFMIRTFKKGIVIAGHDGSLIPGSYNIYDWSRYRINGTAYGAYDFLERVLGMRYYYPGIGVYVPEIKNLTVQSVAYTDKPEFKNRYHWAWHTYLSKKKWPWKNVNNDALKFVHAWRMGQSSRQIFSHSPSPQLMGKAYPNKIKQIFYTSKSGFTYYNPSTHIGNLFDVTSPEFADILVASWKKYYDTKGKWNIPWRGRHKPNSEYVDFGQADTFVSIDNERAKKWINSGTESSRTMSDLYFNFYIMLAERLKRELPEKKLAVYAYHHYRLAPLKIKSIPDNIVVIFCNSRPVTIKSPEVRKTLVKHFKEWYDFLKKPVNAYTYGAEGNAITKAIQGRYMKDYIKLASPYLSRENLFYDSGRMPLCFYYSYYPVYRVMWNSEFDQDAALDEHWELLYGKKAGDSLKEFYRILVSRWETKVIPKIGTKRISDDLLYKKGFPPAVIDKLEKLLREANDATVPGSIERKRVQFFTRPWPMEFNTARAYVTMVIPTYAVKRLATGDNIKIDGEVNDKAWSLAKEVNMQDALGRGTELPSKPNIRLLWDDNGLYLATIIQGKPAIKKGDIFFKSDNIEFFLSPGTSKTNYFQFAINPTSDLHDASRRLKPIEAGLDSQWKCKGIQYATKVSKDKWELEMFIPFSGLNCEKPKAYQSWFMNVMNNKHSPKEYSSFSLTMRNNHNISLYGKIKFLGKGD